MEHVLTPLILLEYGAAVAGSLLLCGLAILLVVGVLAFYVGDRKVR